ncbi:hypothetical protein HDU76_012481 [Blyttiomyces sp. JEL0837]|nr:hypothetical protein HDU76_012481 [Blyttiomyces sp. JEL0837]
MSEPEWYKAAGISLALSSGLFIGSSFIFKKKGLLDTKATHGEVGSGHDYLKSPMWWTGMILMALGEVANFGAYAFTPAILVTPLGALSVVISSAILFRGFAVESAISGISLVMGFLVIVGGVSLLFEYSLQLTNLTAPLKKPKSASGKYSYKGATPKPKRTIVEGVDDEFDEDFGDDDDDDDDDTDEENDVEFGKTLQSILDGEQEPDPVVVPGLPIHHRGISIHSFGTHTDSELGRDAAPAAFGTAASVSNNTFITGTARSRSFGSRSYLDDHFMTPDTTTTTKTATTITTSQNQQQQRHQQQIAAKRLSDATSHFILSGINEYGGTPVKILEDIPGSHQLQQVPASPGSSYAIHGTKPHPHPHSHPHTTTTLSSSSSPPPPALKNHLLAQTIDESLELALSAGDLKQQKTEVGMTTSSSTRHYYGGVTSGNVASGHPGHPVAPPRSRGGGGRQSENNSKPTMKADDTLHLTEEASTTVITTSPEPKSPSTASPRVPFLQRLVGAHLKSFDETTLVTSYYVSPETLLKIRLFSCIWCLCIIPLSIVNTVNIPKFTYVAFFTNLSWWGLIIYFGVSAFNTYIYIKNGYSARLLHSRHPVWRWLSWNLYLFPATFHYIVPVVFWMALSRKLIADGHAFEWFVNLNVHFADLLFIIMEFILGRIPVYASQWTGPIFVAILYLVWSLVNHILFTPSVSNQPENFPDGFWAYPFMREDNHYFYYIYILLAVFFLLIFVAVSYAHQVRDRRRERLGYKVVKGLKQSSV